MKNNLGFMIAGILTFVFLLNVISAGISVGTIPALSRNSGTFNVSVSSNQSEDVTLSFSNIPTGIIITPSTATLTLNSINSNADSQVFTYTIPSNFEFDFGKTYKFTLNTVGTLSRTLTPAKTISFAVNEDYCEELDEADGDLSVSIEDINNNGFGEENEWLPLDEVEV